MDQEAGTGPAGETVESVGRRIDDLRERAAGCDDPREQADYRRSADSLARLALALDPPGATPPHRAAPEREQ